MLKRALSDYFRWSAAKYSGKYKFEPASNKARKEQYLRLAIANIERALKFNPTDFRALIMKAMFLRTKGELKESLRLFSEGLVLCRKQLSSTEDKIYVESYCGYWMYWCAMDLNLDEKSKANCWAFVRDSDLKKISFALLLQFPGSFLPDWQRRLEEIDGPALLATDFYEVIPAALIGAFGSYLIFESIWIALSGFVLLPYFQSVLFYEARKSSVSIHEIWPLIPIGWIANYISPAPVLVANIGPSLGILGVSLIAYWVLGRARTGAKWWPLTCVLSASMAWVGVLGSVVALIGAGVLAYVYVYRAPPKTALTAIGKWPVCGYIGGSFAIVWLYPALSFNWLLPWILPGAN